MRAHKDLVSAKANLLWQVKDAAFSAAAGRSHNHARASGANEAMVSAKANLLEQVKAAAFCAAAGRSQNVIVVRFWIITMMLVLVGLSTLKLR